jgi:hypothetical protein
MSAQPHEHEHHPIRDELHHLHDVVEKGESAETPLILIGGIMLWLLPLLAVLITAGLLIYYFA